MSEFSIAAWWFPLFLYFAIFAGGFVAGLLWYRRKGDAEVARLVSGWKADRELLRDRVDQYAEKITGKADTTMDRLDAEFEQFVSRFEK